MSTEDARYTKTMKDIEDAISNARNDAHSHIRQKRFDLAQQVVRNLSVTMVKHADIYREITSLELSYDATSNAYLNAQEEIKMGIQNRRYNGK